MNGEYGDEENRSGGELAKCPPTFTTGLRNAHPIPSLSFKL
jgi:hypothetical protein